MRLKGSETVLVVDDDPLMLNVIEQGISFYGYKPIVASNGEEALKVAAEKKIDLLVTDIMMPGMNGIDLAKKFAVINPEAKILFMSGYVCPSIAHQGIPESEFAFIQKPFAPDTLVKKVQKVLRGPEGLKEIEDPQPD
ncbi:MAG: response regulator [Desulfobulbales bacterium]|nr:response regulator [Desulfobulbales bacterium]